MTLLAKLRKSKQMTQVEIAKDLEISPKSWQAYETGFRVPKPATMQKIEDYFGIRKEVIFSAAFSYKTELKNKKRNKTK